MAIKIKQMLLIIVVSILSGTGLFLICGAFDYENIYQNANVWYKVSTDEFSPGEVVALDMTKGYSTCDGGLIYIIIYTIDSNEEVVVAFPDGGYWSNPGADTTSMEIQKAFGKLEQDLKSR